MARKSSKSSNKNQLYVVSVALIVLVAAVIISSFNSTLTGMATSDYYSYTSYDQTDEVDDVIDRLLKEFEEGRVDLGEFWYEIPRHFANAIPPGVVSCPTVTERNSGHRCTGSGVTKLYGSSIQAIMAALNCDFDAYQNDPCVKVEEGEVAFFEQYCEEKPEIGFEPFELECELSYSEGSGCSCKTLNQIIAYNGVLGYGYYFRMVDCITGEVTETPGPTYTINELMIVLESLGVDYSGGNFNGAWWADADYDIFYTNYDCAECDEESGTCDGPGPDAA